MQIKNNSPYRAPSHKKKLEKDKTNKIFNAATQIFK